MFVGVAIKSGRGNEKGSGIITSPLPAPLHIYCPSNRTQNSLSYKKTAFSLQTVKKQIFFHIFEKIVFFWSLMVPFKAFASLRLQSETIRGQKNTFFSDEKTNYCFWPVFREKNTIFRFLILAL